MAKHFIIIFAMIFCCKAAADPGDLQLVEKKLPFSFELMIRTAAVYNLYQDSRGFVWILTTQGLVQYDGYEFKYFRHDKNNPRSIAHSIAILACEDKKGNIWFGLISGGLSCYNPLTNTFKNYSTKSIIPGSNDFIQALYIDSNDEVWFSIGFKGLSHLDKENGTFETYPVVTEARCPNTKPHKVPLHNFLQDMEERDENNLWLGTPEGLFSFNKKTKEITVMRPKLSKNMHHDVYNAKSIIKDGRKIWIGGWGSGIQCYDTLTATWTDYSLLSPGENYSVSNIINGMIRKDEDEFWIASADKGLGIFNTTTQRFRFLKNDPEYSYLPKTGGIIVFTDKQNNLYAVFRDNLFFFTQKPNLFKQYKLFIYQEKNSGLAVSNDLYEDPDGRFLYAATSYSDGIIVYDKLNSTSKAANLQMGNKKIIMPEALQFLERDSNSVWLLTYDVLYVYYYRSGKIVQPPQPPLLNLQRNSNSYLCMAKGGKDFLWIGTNYDGVIKYDIKSGNSQVFGRDEKDTTHIAAISGHVLTTDSKNNLWYGNYRNSVLAHYNTQTGRNTFYDKDGNPCIRSKSVSVYTFYSDHNLMYVCTPSGILIFDISGNDPKVTGKINAENRFTSDLISAIAKENDSIFWMSTVYGIVRFNMNTSLYEVIGIDDGLKRQAINVLQSNTGKIYVGGPGEFYEYLPYTQKAESKTMAPVLTSFKVNGTDINYTLSLSRSNKVMIEPGYNYFAVSFSSLDYANTANIKYSYMLEGFNKEWINSGDIRYATFSNLAGGNYTLKLRTTMNNGSTFSEVTGIPIHIGTIYYQTWWFKLTLSMVTALIIVLFYRYRAGKEHAIMELNTRTQLLEKEKSIVQYENLKQQLNPHFLFNSLTSLSSLISTEPKNAKQFVDRMSKIYRYILKSNENEMVPLIDEVNFADTYVKLQLTRFSSGLQVNMDVGEAFHHRKIVPVTIQNAIENAIKHNIIEDESPLLINIYIDDDCLVVKNNLQRKAIVETSNRHGLNQVKSLYSYLSDRPIVINETESYFEIKIPLI